MVCKAFTVLTAIVKIERHSHIFADPAQLSNMCERVALPNISLRRKFEYIYFPGRILRIKFFFYIVVDEELFEDNPIEYIRRDLEGSGKNYYIFFFWDDKKINI